MQHQKPSPPTMIFCAAAPPDVILLSQWEMHLLPLMQARQITVQSERHLPAGAPRTEILQEHLDQAQVILFLLSADFFASDECMVLMTRALEGKARVIPLLLRASAWQESPLASLTCLPPNGIPVISWDHPEEAFHACYKELLHILGRDQSPATPKPTPPSPLQNQNRIRMLRRLRRSYIDLMNQSLQGAAWLELGLAGNPDAVQNAANFLLRVESRPEQPLPPGTSITQVYDETEHELLILGEPGAGKSTLLLDLAKHLLTRAERDETHPLPVILPLSSWAAKRPPLQDWIAEQLAQIYDVPRQLSEQWVKEERILPLLDGLDEMEETARPACIAEINVYHHEHLIPLVVCSRTTEYEAAISCHRLALQGAVVVQPLTREDVDAYLVRAGESLTALRNALKENTHLQMLSTTPLMLNILTLTYQGRSVRGLSSNKETLLLKQVWDDYVQRMVTRKGNSKRYPPERTRAWLSYLAQQMRKHNQTVFYLEHLQPDWLKAKQQCTYAKLGIRLPAIMIGVLVSILVQWFFLGNTGLLPLLLYGVMGGLLGGLWPGSVEDLGSHSNPLSDRQFSKRERRPQIRTARVRLLPLNVSQYQKKHHPVWRKRLAISTCIGLICGFSFGFLGPDYTLRQWQAFGPFYGVGIGLFTLLLQPLLTLPLHPGTSPENGVPRRWKPVARFGSRVHARRALLVAVTIGLIAWLSRGLFDGPSFDLIGWLRAGRDGLALGLSGGLSVALISSTLATQIGDIHLAERMRWTWRTFLRGLFNEKHLRVTVLLTCTIMIFFWLGFALDFGPTIGLSVGSGLGLIIGLSYWLLLGLFQGMAQERIEDQDRRVPNQGIHRSLRNSVVMGIISGAVIGSISVLNTSLSLWLIWLNIGVSSGLSAELGVGPLLGGALLICMLTGGLAVWRHFIIRLLLWHSHTFPWKAPQFLDDATTRFLLRRVGGGYSFTHRLLLDHLADTETGVIAKASAPPIRLPHS
jgi:hypothetical protein